MKAHCNYCQMVIITSVVEIELAILINQIKLHLSVFSKV